MKSMKKISALLLALVMVLAMGTTAFAATIPAAGTVESTDNTISFKNVLTAFNAESAIYGPDVTYTFSIAAATETSDGVGVTITDNKTPTPVSAPVLAGVGTPTFVQDDSTTAATYTYSFSPATEIDSSASGAANEKTITVSFNGITYERSGIYRYKVTRALSGNGVTNINQDTNTATRYLDVYVNGSGAIYGYVLHYLTTDITASASPTKSDGYYDTYYTSNITVGKTLENDALMNSHTFPFSITFSNGAQYAHIKVSTVGTAMAAGDLTSYQTIKTGDTVSFIGIPNGVTVTAYETNDVSGTTYSSTQAITPATTAGTGTAGTSTAGADKQISWGTMSSYTAYAEQAYNSNQASVTTGDTLIAQTFTVQFTNTLLQISPTGVVLRIAPYVLMLGAGVALFIVFAVKRRKNDGEEET